LLLLLLLLLLGKLDKFVKGMFGFRLYFFMDKPGTNSGVDSKVEQHQQQGQ
jgi:hypothetical protein